MELFFLALILFSTLGMIFILGAKVYEINSSQVGVLGKLSLSLDSKLSYLIEKSKDILSEINHANFRKTLHLIAHNLFHVFGTVGLFVSKQHKNFKERIVDGHGTVKKKGVVSFFLKDVAESREKKDLSE